MAAATQQASGEAAASPGLNAASGPFGVGWLMRLRWVVALGVVLATLVASSLGHLPGSAGWVAAGFVTWIGVTQLGLLDRWARAEPRGRPVDTNHVGALFVADILALTLVLWLTGGPSNPFSVLYFLYISLAAVALGPRWAWGLVALSCVAYGALFLPLANQLAEGATTGHMHHHGSHGPAKSSGFDTHLAGMWWAFAFSSALAASFLTRLAHEIRDRDGALARAREGRERYVRLGSMLSLAAGAAHELGTPLGTIAVAAKELERGAPEDLRQEARVIRHEVDRCREIVDRLSARSGELAGELPTRLTLDELWQRVQSELPAACRGRLDVHVVEGSAAVKLPAQAFGVAIANLVVNGCEASRPDQRVQLEMAVEAGVLQVLVRDHGEGIDPDKGEQLFDPFVTTKGESGGMGLGLYVVRALLEPLGGDLSLRPADGRGTVAELRVPARLAQEAG